MSRNENPNPNPNPDLYAGLSDAQRRELDTARKLEDEAEAFYQNEEFLEAKGCYVEALAIRESLFGKSSVRLTKTLAGLAVCAVSLPHPEEAREYEQRGLSIMRDELGEGNWSENDTFYNLLGKYRQVSGLDV
jgi:tetratricopeptide (TPR) repeat protein